MNETSSCLEGPGLEHQNCVKVNWIEAFVILCEGFFLDSLLHSAGLSVAKPHCLGYYRFVVSFEIRKY